MATMVGTIIAAIGVITPIAWDWHKSSSAIVLQHISTLTLIDANSRLKKLTLHYDNQPIENIAKMTFDLVNTGRKAILKGDLVSPPTLTFSNARILDFQVERLDPANLVYKQDIDYDKGKVALSFELLNPGDVVEFSVLLDKETTFKAEALVAGIKRLQLIDRRSNVNQRERPWRFYIVAVFTAFMLLAWLGLRMNIKKTTLLKNGLTTGTIGFPKNALPEKYMAFLLEKLSFKNTLKKFQALQHFIQSLPANQQLSVEQQRQAEYGTISLLDDPTDTYALIVVSAVILAGTYYLWSFF